jgi:DNA-binding response OmpR family regulator
MPDTIVVVDDAPEILRVAEVSLQRAGGFQVFCAADAEAGIALILTHRPCLALLDVMMPRVTGPDLLVQIRAHAEIAHTPVVFMSAVCGEDQIKALESSGALGVIAKPFRPLQLVAQVRALLAKIPLETIHG